MSARMPALTAVPNAVPSTAQWALARMLEAAFDDTEVAHRCVQVALENAGRRTIPEGVEELLTFGREFLVPVLAEELGPRIVAMLFEDLGNELSKLRRSDVRLAPVPRAFRRPSTGPRPIVTAASEVPVSSSPLRPSLPTIQSPAPRDSLPVGRPVVAIVEGDRWRRAPIARALVQNGCDVLPLDSASAALDHLQRGLCERVDVVVMEIAGEEERTLLRQLLLRFPSIRAIAWTETEDAAARLDAAGLVAFAHLPRTAAPAQVADVARKLV